MKILALPALLLLASCGTVPPAPIEAATVTVPPPAEALGPIPVTDADPVLGRPDAWVTVVVFGDVESPFFRDAIERVRGIAATLGAEHLRLSVKHLPMPSHREAALTAAAVQEAGGSAAFFRFHAALAGVPGGGSAHLEDLAAASGVPRDALRRAQPGAARKLAEDAALAATLKIDGGTRIFVDGAECAARTGCNWMDVAGKSPLLSLIEAETERARKALATGTPQRRLYAVRCEDNLAHPAPEPPAAAEVSDVFGARHLLVQFAGAMRAAPTITRTREEARARAMEAFQKARAGARFEDLVAQYSDEPGAAKRGGDLGTFRRGQMVPTFQAAVEATRVGELTGVMETPFGFHVILRTR